MEVKKVNYRLLSGFLVTFTTTITIDGKVSFAMPCTPRLAHPCKGVGVEGERDQNYLNNEQPLILVVPRLPNLEVKF